MITKNGILRCDICNKFMNMTSKHYVWVPYGQTNDAEQPVEEHSHVNCFEWHEHITKKLIERTSYVKPCIKFENDCNGWIG